MALAGRRAAIAVCVTLSACAAAPAGPDHAGTAYGAFLAARYADSREDPTMAAAYYARALAADPGNSRLLGEGFVAALLAGAPNAVTLAPKISHDALAIMLLGNQAAIDGDYHIAGQDYSTLPHDDLAGVLAPLLLAWTQAGGGDLNGALALLAPNFNAGQFGPIYLLNAALIADAGGDQRDAATYYSAVAGSGAAPNLRLTQILASWQARQGQMADATAQLAGLMAAHPDLRVALPALRANIAAPVITTPRQGLAEAYLTLAGILDQPEQVVLRLTFLHFALALRPDLAAARLLLAASQTETGDPKVPPSPAQLNTALQTLNPVPATDALYGPAVMQQAGLLTALNRPDEAVALIDKLTTLDPGDPAPPATAGDILRSENRNAQAIAAYGKAISLSGQPAPAEAWSLYFDRGIAEDQAGDWAAAQPDMLNALALSPNQPYVLNYLAYSWAQRGEKLDQAHAMLEQAVGLDPNDGAVIDSLGYVTLRQGDKARAVTLLTQAVELDPQDAEVNAHLGDAFWASGMKLQASYQWARALSLKPDPKLQAEIEAKLKQVGQPG